MDEAHNAYEAEREARIAANKAKLHQLGLAQASHALACSAGHRALPESVARGGAAQPRAKPRARQSRPPPEPARLSKRLRGEAAPAAAAAAAAARAEAAADAADAAALGTTRKGAARRQVVIPEGTTFDGPFSLRSIATTVWELGQVHRGAWAHRFWSSPGCLYHHAYPVGFRATKLHFGRVYEMRIEAGPTGPRFVVADAHPGGARYEGDTPTRPWTDVCLAHRTGQRISGPRFFGFSDPATQAAIAARLYSPQELAAALAGETVGAAAPSQEELAARRFAALPGVGEAAGMALARTVALGGARHAGPEALRRWARAAAENAAALLRFLRDSEELPEATRRWPAWRARMVPTIMAALTGEDPVEEPAGVQGAGVGDGAEGQGGNENVAPAAVKQAFSGRAALP
jgi:hypothetical protein